MVRFERWLQSNQCRAW